MTRTYTSVANRILFAISGGVIGFGAGAGLMGLVEHTAWETPGLVVLGVLVVTGVWRGARARVVVDGHGLVVHNLFRTCRVRWADVIRVKECAPWPWSARQDFPCPALVVRGRRRRVALLAMTDLGDHRFADTVRDWRRRYR